MEIPRPAEYVFHLRVLVARELALDHKDQGRLDLGAGSSCNFSKILLGLSSPLESARYTEHP